MTGAGRTARGKGGNSQTYRRLNRGLILKLIATGSCASRVDLARRTGLTKMAVSNIIAEMLEEGLVEETSSPSNEVVGRNPIRLKIASTCPKAAGVLLLRERLEVVLCDFNLHVLKRESRRMSGILNLKDLTENLFEMLDEILKGEEKVLGIGAASIGPVDAAKGEILEPFYFWGKHIPLSEILKERYHVPILLNHDNHCGALAELLYGSGMSCRDFLFLGMGRGIGCGMVLNGELYEHQEGLAAEIGHTSIDYQGPLCTCGNRGCLECYISTPLIQERLIGATGEDEEFGEFCRRYQEPLIKEVFDDGMKKLAAALINYVNLLNPKRIILGHDGVQLYDDCIRVLEEEINKTRFFQKAQAIEIVKSGFGRDAQLFGAACLVFGEAFQGKLLF